MSRIISIIKAVIARRSSESFISYHRKKGITIGDDCIVRDPLFTKIDTTRPYLVKIGNRVDMNRRFEIWTHDWGGHVLFGKYKRFFNSSGKVVIGNNVYFGSDCKVLKGVTIGDNCIIGAGSLVNRDIPANSVATGNPCRVVCSLDEYYKKREERSIEEAVEVINEFYDFYGKDPDDNDLKEERHFYSKIEGTDEIPMFNNRKEFIAYCHNNRKQI